MSYIIIPSIAKRQPFVPARINRSNPLAYGLVLALPSPFDADAVSGAGITRASTFAVSASSAGLMCDTTGTTGFGSVPLDLSHTYRVTVSCLGVFDVFDATSQVTLELTSNYNTNAGFIFQTRTSGGASPSNAGKVSFLAWRSSTSNIRGAFLDSNPSVGLRHFIITHDKNVGNGSTQIWVDGVKQAVTDCTVNTPVQTTNGFAKSSLYILARNNTSLGSSAQLSNICVWDRVLTDNEISVIFGNPWGIYSSRSTEIYLGDGAGGATVTGTLAATDGADLAAFAGAQEFTGTLSATDGADLAAFAGAQEFTGTLSATDGADLAAFAGTSITGIDGALAATDGADDAAFSGLHTITVAGSLSATDVADGSTFSGLVANPVAGTFGAIDGADDAAFSGTHIETVTGTFAAIDGPDDAAFSGALAGSVAGTLDATDGADIALFVEISTAAQPSSKRIDNTIMRIGSVRIDRCSTRIG